MRVLTVIFYEVGLWVLALFALPKLCYSYFFKNKYRKSLAARLGFNLPDFSKSSLPSIWIHAVSVGETKAVAVLARQIKNQFPKHSLIISSTTETGHEEAKRSLPFADYHVFLPFDFKCIVSKVIKKARPAVVLLCETDFWFNFLQAAKKSGAQIAIVNGKLSGKSKKNFQKYSFFSRQLFESISLFCVQDEVYESRFLEIGIPEEKVSVTGNLKWDDIFSVLTEQEVIDWKKRLGIKDELVLTIGSTHKEEEELFISVIKGLLNEQEYLKIILVPRHPERISEVVQLLNKYNLSYVLFTDIQESEKNVQVVLVNVIGKLRVFYQLCDIALVAGSFTERVGGHNLMEPSAYGKPVVFGPIVHAQLELAKVVVESGAGIQTTREKLKSDLKELITNKGLREEIGERGFVMVNRVKRSVNRTLEVLKPIFRELEK